MTTESRILDLLQRWEALRKEGKELTPEELCADCPELVEKVRGHLRDLQAFDRERGTTGSYAPALATAGDPHATHDPSDMSAAASAPWPSVAGYEILSELGRGGMGVVYQARQVALNRLVALKMIRAGELASVQEVARFRREARAVARMQHPNIVHIFEVGEQDGLPFFSLEYVPGGSLAQRLDGTPLPARDAARLVETLAGAMQAAHDQGIVHRDLKPANVLLHAADGGPQAGAPSADLRTAVPKITDFGLAKRQDESFGPTQSGAVMGTPSYMAPEQAAGKTQAVGPATDVYALGAILYELLTGRPPFKAATSLDTIFQVVHDEPIPPGQLHPRLSRDLETVCLKCLQKEASARYPSAALLAGDLRRFLDGQPIQARPVTAAEKLWRWARRNRTVAGLTIVSVLLLLVLAIGATVTSFYWEGLAQEKEKQRRKAEDIARELLKANNLKEEFRRQLESQRKDAAVEIAQKKLDVAPREALNLINDLLKLELTEDHRSRARLVQARAGARLERWGEVRQSLQALRAQDLNQNEVALKAALEFLSGLPEEITDNMRREDLEKLFEQLNGLKPMREALRGQWEGMAVEAGGGE